MPYGSAIHVPTYALSRDPEYWGANADSFDLTRFLPENKDKLVPGAYMSFGGGPRICPGIRMSQFMLKRMIAPILQRFSLEHPVPVDIVFPVNSRKASDAASRISVRFRARSAVLPSGRTL